MLRPLPSFAYDALGGRVVFGVGAVEHLGEEVDRLGGRRVLAIAGKRAVDGLVERLGDRWVASFTDVQQHVPVEVAARAAAAAAEAGRPPAWPRRSPWSTRPRSWPSPPPTPAPR
jgi:maleylacetate reductase